MAPDRKKIGMCQYDTDAHPGGAGGGGECILTRTQTFCKNEVEKRAITLIMIGGFYPESYLTCIL